MQFLKLAGGHGDVLTQVAGGEMVLACALGERQSRHELMHIQTTARKVDGHYVIDGSKSAVLHGAQAGYLIVSARSAGAHSDAQGISLFMVPADSAGIRIRDARSNDGMRMAAIDFKQVKVPAASLLGVEGEGWALLEAATDHGVALLCAEALGVMEALTDATLEYLKTRQQFGVPIGKFQVLQHRMAELFMQLEHLKFTNRHTELLACLKILEGRVRQCFHHAQRLCT